MKTCSTRMKNHQRVTSERRTSRLQLMKELDFINPFPSTSKDSKIGSLAFRAYLYKKWLQFGISKLETSVTGNNVNYGQSDARNLLGSDANERKLEISEVKDPAKKQIKILVEPSGEEVERIMSSLIYIRQKNNFMESYSEKLPSMGNFDFSGTSLEVQDHFFKSCRSKLKRGSFNRSSRNERHQAIQNVSHSFEDLSDLDLHPSKISNIGFDSMEKDLSFSCGMGSLLSNKLESNILTSPLSVLETTYSVLPLNNPVLPNTILNGESQSPRQNRCLIFNEEELQKFENIMGSPFLSTAHVEESPPTHSTGSISNRLGNQMVSPWNTHTPILFSPSITSLHEVLLERA